MLYFIAQQRSQSDWKDGFFSELSTIAAIMGIGKTVTISILHEENF